MNQARHLWDLQWFRDLVLILVVLIVLFLAYSLRGILLPIVMALALAYAFHPLITWLHVKSNIPRWLSTTGILAITSAAVLSLLLWMTPQLLSQTRSLYARLPGYTKYATQKFEDLQVWAKERDEDPAASQPASQPASKPATQPASKPATSAFSQSDDEALGQMTHTDKQRPTTQSATTQPATTQPAATQPVTDSTPDKLTVGEALPLIESAVDEIVGDQAANSQTKSDEAAANATKAKETASDAKQTTPTDTRDTIFPAHQASEEDQKESGFFWKWGLGSDDESTSEHAAHDASAGAATTQPSQSRTAWSKALSEMDFTTVGSMLVQTFNYGLGVVGVTLSLGMYLALVMALLVLGFFFFSWKFDRIIHWFDSFIPQSKRPRILHILGKMDRAISAFVRGRLVQVSIITCVLCVGWAWVGVPYWLLLGVLGGMLNIVPYAAVVAWPIAILLMWIDTASGSSGATFTFTQVFVWPSVVYIVAQGLDGWVVEPLVQGKATNLDPFSVLVAVIIGGSLLGILGTIIAVPTAACLKIFLEEVVLPHVRGEIHRRDKAAIAIASTDTTFIASQNPIYNASGMPSATKPSKPDTAKPDTSKSDQ